MLMCFCRETYGPFTRCYDQENWASLSLDERARLMARQGHAFATAEEVRVVNYKEGSDIPQDVPADGKTLGEIVTRGNIVMKEVHMLLFPSGCFD
jgi:hypothetical protein